MNQKLRNTIFKLSCVFVLAGAALYITNWAYSPYLFAIGAAGVTLFYLTQPTEALNFRLRRLHRINIIAGTSMLASSVFMFRRSMEWVVFLLISALLILYTSFINPRND